MGAHQLLDLAAPAEHSGKPPNSDLQVAQLHVVPSPQRDPLEGTHGVPVQKKTWNGGAHGVHQAGERLNLQRVRIPREWFIGDSTQHSLRVQTYLQGGAHNDQQVRFGEILSVEEILLREVLSKKHHVRFDGGGTEGADGHFITHDGRL